MSLQVLPPEMLEAPKEKIETKEPQPYFKPSSLKDGESEEFRLLGCYETGHAVVGWQYASEKPGPDGELKFAGYVVTRTHPGSPSDIARETDWAKPDRPKIDGTSVKPRKFLAFSFISETSALSFNISMINGIESSSSGPTFNEAQCSAVLPSLSFSCRICLRTSELITGMSLLLATESCLLRRELSLVPSND